MAMGILLILLGLVAAGIVTDFVVENGLAVPPQESFQLLGGTFHVSRTELVLGAAALGALAIIFLVMGLGLLRGSWGRRRGLKRRVADLERENAEIRSKAHLEALVKPEESRERSPESD